MRLRFAGTLLALAICWTACEDRTFELGVDAGNRTPTTVTGSGGSRSTGSDASTGNDADDDFHPQSTHTADGSSSTSAASTNGGDSSTNSPFGSTGTGGVDGRADASGSGGSDSGAPGTGGRDNDGGNEGGQTSTCTDSLECPCDPKDLACVACVWAAYDCSAPTPDCQGGWAESTWQRDCRCPSCPAGMRCFDESRSCRVECFSNEDCPQAMQPMVCHPQAALCVECTDDTHCANKPDSEYCLAGSCEQCRTGPDCPMSAPHCIAGVCRGCVSHLECADPDKPLCAGYGCVECLDERDCENGQQCAGSCYWP